MAKKLIEPFATIKFVVGAESYPYSDCESRHRKRVFRGLFLCVDEMRERFKQEFNDGETFWVLLSRRRMSQSVKVEKAGPNSRFFLVDGKKTFFYSGRTKEYVRILLEEGPFYAQLQVAE